MHTVSLDRRLFLAAAGGALLSTSATAASKPRPAPAARAGQLTLAGAGTVARMGFGAMRITGEGIWGEPRDAREARAVLRRAVELGVTFIDTADSYGPLVSERLIAEALHPYPADLVIATKGGLTRPGPNRWVPDCRPEHLRAACEGSLKRLKLDSIPLWQLHTADPKVPYADSLGEVARLQQEGKIRAVGISNVNVEQLTLARSLVKVVSVQNRYSAADRTSEPVLAACERDGIAFIPWGPLATREQQSGRPNASLDALGAIATERGITLAQAALAWLLAKSPMMLPIPGTSRLTHLEENVAAAAIRFSAAEMQRVG